MMRYLSSYSQSRHAIRNLLLGAFVIIATPGYSSETSQFAAILNTAQASGSKVEQISTRCSPQPQQLLGYVNGNILCLRATLSPQTMTGDDSPVLAAFALSHALADVENRRKAKPTLGRLLEGMAAAAVESDIQGRESARPERQARHDRPYALDRDRPYFNDQVGERVATDMWMKRGLQWAKLAGTCESDAMQMLERIKRSEQATPQDRAEAKALLGALGFLRYHPEPCA